jgi:hypothetical protein
MDLSFLSQFINTSAVGGYVRAGVAAGLGVAIAKWPWLSQFLSPATQTALGTAAAGIAIGAWSHVVKWLAGKGVMLAGANVPLSAVGAGAVAPAAPPSAQRGGK